MTLSPEERERRRAKALAAAKVEAAQLKEIQRLQREEGKPYAEGMKEVGLVLPHSTLQWRLNRLEQAGVEGLLDRRHPPPSRLTPEIRGFIEGAGRANPALPVRKIRELVFEQFKVDLKPRTIENALKRAGLARAPVRFTTQVQPSTLRAAAESVVEESLGAAGMAWLTMGDDLVGYTAGLAAAIQEAIQDIPAPSPVTPAERENRDDRGRFLPEYNAPEERRDPEVGARFESVEIKRAEKDLGRMRIIQSRPETLRAKLLAFMALPMVTDRGHFDGATDARGTLLEGLGGIDYQPETLTKFGRELKYAGVSGVIQETHAQIWYVKTKSWIGEGACCSVLYVDTTVKPLWTEHFHKSGRVAMLGRVMPCVETVLINNGAGVPLLVKTYSGHQALTNNVLPLIDELEAAIGEGMLGRLTVIDGEMDCVALFKQFDARPGRYFIVPLDRSRVKDLSSIEGLHHMAPYRDGDSIGGGWLNLTDSQDPEAPPYRIRVIALQRRTKRTFTVFGSNTPCEEFSDEVLMDVYFSRWPKQEQVFRQLNGATSFNAAHGYGKQKVVNITVVDQMTKLAAQIERVDEKLQKARTEEKGALDDLLEATTTKQDMQSAKKTLQAQEKHVAKQSGKHTTTYQLAASEAREAASEAEVAKLKLEKAKSQHEQARTKVEKLAATLIEKKAISQMLESRREIYQTDVELDQIISVLKVGFLLILQWLLHMFFGSMKIDLLTFANQILLMPGVRLRTETTETVRFTAHRRNPEMMQAIDKACRLFNALRHHHNGRLVRFELYWPPGIRDHAA